MKRHSEYIGCYLDFVQGKMIDASTSKMFVQSALHLASRLGMQTCVSTLLKRGAEIDALNDEDMTPLMHASQQGHTAVVKFLVENCANVNISNSRGRLALHYSCFGGHRECTEILLKYKSKPNYPDNDGITPLILACRSNVVQVVQAVLDAGAKPDKVDNMKRSALHWAALSSNKDIVDALIKAGASLDLMDKYFATAFMYSIFNDNAAALRCLVASGCDSTAIDGMNGTALTLASLKGHDSCVGVLLSAGEDPNEFSYFGMTALMASVYESHFDVTQTILCYKPNINIVSRLGFTALFAALCHINQNNAAVRHKLLVLLIQHGVDINQPFGCTTAFSSIMKGKNSPLLFAVSTGYVSLVKILLYAGSRLNFNEIECLKNADMNKICKVSFALRAILDYKCKPLPLQHLCRVSIRRELGSDIHEKLQNLPVPKTLRVYLNFSDLVDVSPQHFENSCSFQDLALTMLDLKPCGLQAIEGSFLFEQVKESVLQAQQPGPCSCNTCMRIRDLQHVLQQ